MRHKWAEVIKAWLDGKTVQFKMPDYNDGQWSDFNARCLDSFDDLACDWRIKPVKKYRVALCFGSKGEFTTTADTDEYAQYVTTQFYFAKWLTDWVYYE